MNRGPRAASWTWFISSPSTWWPRRATKRLEQGLLRITECATERLEAAPPVFHTSDAGTKRLGSSGDCRGKRSTNASRSVSGNSSRKHARKRSRAPRAGSLQCASSSTMDRSARPRASNPRPGPSSAARQRCSHGATGERRIADAGLPVRNSGPPLAGRTSPSTAASRYARSASGAQTSRTAVAESGTACAAGDILLASAGTTLSRMAIDFWRRAAVETLRRLFWRADAQIQ